MVKGRPTSLTIALALSSMLTLLTLLVTFVVLLASFSSNSAAEARPALPGGHSPSVRAAQVAPSTIMTGSWTNVFPDLLSVSAVSGSEAWAAGEYGHLLHYTGGSWTPVDPPSLAVTSTDTISRAYAGDQGTANQGAPLNGAVSLSRSLYVSETDPNSKTENTEVQKGPAMAREGFPRSPRQLPQRASAIARPSLDRQTANPASVLFDQYGDETTYGISSQNFEQAFNAYDDEAADDFQVPTGQTWSIDHIEVAGAYLGTGPADSVNVAVYMDNAGRPGTTILTRSGVPYSPGPTMGEMVIPLNPPGVLNEGHYWLSVQANQSYGVRGQWLWRYVYGTQGNQAVWRNPLGGFGARYTGWGAYCVTGICYSSYAFRLDGSITGATGTPQPTITAAATYTPASPRPTSTGTLLVPSPVATAPAPFPTATPTYTETPGPLCGPYWRIQSPPPDLPHGDLKGVAVLSPSDVWTVGTTSNPTVEAISMHWDGRAWHNVAVPSPSPYSADVSLNGVSAISTNDVWAVGHFIYNTVYQPFAVHWNGTQWSLVSIAPPGYTNSHLRGISALASNDVWAVGDTQEYLNGPKDTLIEHWNGTQWSIVPSPSIANYNNELDSVVALSGSDVWAVGTYSNVLTEHWDGTQWTIVPGPNIPSSQNYLYGVDGSSATNVWAVGTSYASSTAVPLVLRWNAANSQWDQVPGPQVQDPAPRVELRSVKVLSPSAVWVAGSYGDVSNYTLPLTALWNGSGWTVQPSPSRVNYSQLESIDSMGPDYAWAVGVSDTPLTMVYDDPCTSRIVGHVTWQSIPQPNARNTGLTATLTLCSGGVPQNYSVSTDASGWFTLTTSLPDGTYNWHLKGSRWLASNGTLTLSNGVASVEMGMQSAGDANGSNGVNTTDFTILKSGFGGSSDLRADFDNDGAVTVADFTLLRSNFGSVGAPANCP